MVDKMNKLNELMRDLLPFEEFRQNDVVEESVLGYECNLLCFNKSTGKYLIKYDQLNNTILKEEFAEDLKFISRDWTLNDLLMAFQQNRDFHTTLLITNKGYLEYYIMEDIVWQVDYDLTKSLLNQSEETLTKIIEVLQ